MALRGKLIGYVDMSSSGADVFHDLFRHKSHELADILPDLVNGCDLHEGKRGAVGAISCWDLTIDGEKRSIKQLVEAVDEEKHMVVTKIIGGYLVDEHYKSFKSTFHVEPNGDGKLATWTFDFEKKNLSSPYPTAIMDYCCTVVKNLDAVHNSTK